jgi:hypothetical protein
MEKPLVESRIKWASLLIGAGLLIQLGTLFRVHPLAFVAFVVIGCPLIGAGVLLYLCSLVSVKQKASEASQLSRMG